MSSKNIIKRLRKRISALADEKQGLHSLLGAYEALRMVGADLEHNTITLALAHGSVSGLRIGCTFGEVMK
jgi:hypothetical protein